MNLVLEIAQELYENKKLQKEDFVNLINAVELQYKNPNNFVTELTNWAVDLMQLDDVVQHAKNFETMVSSFLDSPDADDKTTRTEVLQMVSLFRMLFVNLEGYNQLDIIKNNLK